MDEKSPPPRHDERARKAFGARLRAARNLAGMTLDEVASELHKHGYEYGKAAVGHWETGTRVPDVLILRRLAKMFKVTTDALLWDDSISIDAIRFAADYDSLSESQRRQFHALWMTYFASAKTDSEVEQAFEEAAKKGQSDFTYTKDGKHYHVEVKQTDGVPARKTKRTAAAR